MTVAVIFAAGFIVFGALGYIMVKQYIELSGTEDDDIEVYGGDRIRVRHEAGI